MKRKSEEVEEEVNDIVEVAVGAAEQTIAAYEEQKADPEKLGHKKYRLFGR
jgi:hypothetical protein